MARGGRRVATPGKTYSNRRDLNPPGVSAPTAAVATGQDFGAATNQVRSLQALPMAPTAPQVQGAASPSAPQGPPPSHANIVPLDAPTQRPNEPVTAGVNIGPGPGAGPAPVTMDPETMKSWLPALAILAELPDASTETRNLVRYWQSRI